MPAKEPDEQTLAFGAKVRRYREARQWTQQRLADELLQRGWPTAERTLVLRMEAGRRVTRPGEVETIARALGVPPSVFVSDPFDASTGAEYSDADLEAFAAEDHARLQARREALQRAVTAYAIARDNYAQDYEVTPRSPATVAAVVRAGQIEADRLITSGESRIYG